MTDRDNILENNTKPIGSCYMASWSYHHTVEMNGNVILPTDLSGRRCDREVNRARPVRQLYDLPSDSIYLPSAPSCARAAKLTPALQPAVFRVRANE